MGYNDNKTHPLQQKYNKYRNLYGNFIQHKLHAEISALLKIRHLNINWSKVEIYIFRQNKNGNIATAKPCNSCINFIKDLNIKNIYYTTENGYCHEILKDKKGVN